MKPKATIQWTLAFLLLASCMQAQSIWNTAHLANVKHSIHEPFYATTYEILKAEAVSYTHLTLPTNREV